jgi:hypothetical protein
MPVVLPQTPLLGLIVQSEGWQLETAALRSGLA